jgi:hypothetical protein
MLYLARETSYNEDFCGFTQSLLGNNKHATVTLPSVLHRLCTCSKLAVKSHRKHKQALQLSVTCRSPQAVEFRACTFRLVSPAKYLGDFLLVASNSTLEILKPVVKGCEFQGLILVTVVFFR